MFDLYQLIQMLTVSDSQGGRALKINANGGIDDINNSMTVSDPRGGRSVKVSKENSGLGYVISSSNDSSNAITGNTNENIAVVIPILANTFNSKSIIRLRWALQRTTTGSATFVRAYINSNNTLSGATLIATGTVGTTTIYNGFERDIIFRSATQFIIYNTTLQASTVLQTAASAMSTITFNTKQDMFILITIQLGSSLDSGVIQYNSLLNV